LTARRALTTALVAAVSVLATDLFFGCTLLRTLWPLLLEPREGTVVQDALTVRWDGPPRLRALLLGSGWREDLGMHESPFTVERARFPREGPYTIELRSPILGWAAGSRRSFLVRDARADAPKPEEAGEPPSRDLQDLEESLSRLEESYQSLLAEREGWEQASQALRDRNAALLEEIEDSDDAQMELDDELAEAEERNAELARELDRVRGEAARLQAQLQSIPACTVWGYMTQPRPQTVPPTRFVVVSDGRGELFRTLLRCEATRQTDVRALSVCVCVGAPFDG
jgi:hypothetical protein